MKKKKKNPNKLLPLCFNHIYEENSLANKQNFRLVQIVSIADIAVQ